MSFSGMWWYVGNVIAVKRGVLALIVFHVLLVALNEKVSLDLVRFETVETNNEEGYE